VFFLLDLFWCSAWESHVVHRRHYCYYGNKRDAPTLFVRDERETKAKYAFP